MSATAAIAAAGTTSLPERLGGSKNGDYRFAWVRDLSLTVDALQRCGLQEEVHAAVSWLLVGNFPQALSHLAHINAATALEGLVDRRWSRHQHAGVE